MTQQEFFDYQAAVAQFMAREGIVNLSGDGIIEEFSGKRCDCCKRPLAGMREDCTGYNPTTREVCGPYAVCVDCVYYAEYGRLDDMTMMEIAKG